ncbi:MAG: hypothetical protein F6K53_20175 [Moorea sp. SIO4A1]|uniref:P63C domain-containing protein n=1 Tax=Moorena sp. SIO4A1 TaxID=2607835 RepID=UPI001418E8E3|nr:P63C domain-containing protein [Moorena sp. SIO4A1]NEO43281.1 hypothetical protein [Moorena sp. SIO4A3]NEQ59589.1 hypothetical protein [Moorena sp. SIO4A1]
MPQSFDYDQYRRDSEESYRNPLKVAYLPEFKAVGIDVKVYALPGLDKNPKRYVFSQTNGAKAVKKGNDYIINFLRSTNVKPSWALGFQLIKFRVQGKSKTETIKGVPSDIITEFWIKEAGKGNLAALDLVRVLVKTSIDESVAIAFGINRTFEERKANRILTAEEAILEDPRTWGLHFNKEWQQQAQRITGHPWKRSIVMANFISQTVYKRLPDDVYHRLVTVNQKRNYCHHQFFSAEADEYILRRHIQDVLSLMRISEDKTDFKRNFDSFFQGRGKLSMDINF